MKTFVVTTLLFTSFAGLLAVSMGDGHDRQDARLTELREAIENGNISAIESSIEQGMNMSVVFEDSNAPIHLAARGGVCDGDIVRILIENGADVYAKNNEGQTARDIALAEGKVEVDAILKEAEENYC